MQNLNGLHVSVEDGQVKLSMPSSVKDETIKAADLAAQPIRVQLPAETAYYVALDADDLMQRCVSATFDDRAQYAAMVGNWVSQGYNVQRVTRKELKKLVSKLDAAAKAEEESGAGTAVKEVIQKASGGILAGSSSVTPGSTDLAPPAGSVSAATPSSSPELSPGQAAQAVAMTSNFVPPEA